MWATARSSTCWRRSCIWVDVHGKSESAMRRHPLTNQATWPKKEAWGREIVSERSTFVGNGRTESHEAEVVNETSTFVTEFCHLSPKMGLRWQDRVTWGREVLNETSMFVTWSCQLSLFRKILKIIVQWGKWKNPWCISSGGSKEGGLRNIFGARDAKLLGEIWIPYSVSLGNYWKKIGVAMATPIFGRLGTTVATPFRFLDLIFFKCHPLIN